MLLSVVKSLVLDYFILGEVKRILAKLAYVYRIRKRVSSYMKDQSCYFSSIAVNVSDVFEHDPRSFFASEVCLTIYRTDNLESQKLAKTNSQLIQVNFCRKSGF